MSASTLTSREALALLGLDRGASPETLKAAFRAAAKAARPERAEGDSEKLRKVIEAYRLLQRLQVGREALAAPASTDLMLEISVAEACGGLARSVRLPNGKTLGLRLPAGLRNGDPVRLARQGAEGADLILTVRVRPEPHLRVDGDDVHMTVQVDPRILEDGGRILVSTPAGDRSVWAPRGLADPRRLRLKGQGLPPRGAHERGHLFVTLEPGLATEQPPRAREMLRRFASVWTDRRQA